MPPRPPLPFLLPPPLKCASNATLRSFSSSCPHYQSSSEPPQSPNARWLSQTKARIGKCVMFGLDKEQMGKVGSVLKVLGKEWRDLVAGREGFLVEKNRAGLLRQKVVWGEMDCMSHVNNVTYVRYAESARVNWAYNYGVHIDPTHRQQWHELCTPKGDGMILRTMKTDYKFPMMWPDHISVFHKLRSLPSPKDSSFILDVMILSELHQRPAARCVEDIVMYDYKKGRKTELRPFMMDAFRELWERQEEAKRRVDEKIRAVDEEVRALEMGSWDREGAVEEVGGGR